MTPELEHKLIKDYPHLFSGRARPVTENLMAFGCECGDGWEPIIRDFCAAVMFAMQNEPLEEWPIFVQIKEKFGTLRLYVNSYHSNIDGLEHQRKVGRIIRCCETCLSTAIL